MGNQYSLTETGLLKVLFNFIYLAANMWHKTQTSVLGQRLLVADG